MHKIELTDDEVINLLSLMLMCSIGMVPLPEDAKRDMRSIGQKLMPHRAAAVKGSANAPQG